MSETTGHPRELLSAYLDDELPVEERSRVDHHLALCERCRGELRSLRALARAVREEPVPEPPADLAARIGRRIDAAAIVPMRKRSRFLIPASIAATIGAVGLLVVLQWRQRAPEIAPSAASAPTELQKSMPSAEESPPAPPPPVEPPPPQVPEPKEKVADAVEPSPERRVAGRTEERIAGGFAPEAVPAPPSAPAAQVRADEDRDAKAAAAMPSPAYLGGSASRCAERWVDTALLGAWGVRDVERSTRDLGALARSLGGRIERVEPYPAQIAVIVPRERIAELVAALKRRGVTGLDEPITPEEGFDCVRQRVNLEDAGGSPPR